MLDDGSGAGALGLLDSPFGSGGFPSLSGGDAGPSSAGATSGSNHIGFSNAFSVAGQGGTANATASPSRSDSGVNYAVLGALALAILLLGKAK
ncbi:MAG: hypothetical protein ACRBDL_03410 [Alphaproteobacteria bacterium]